MKRISKKLELKSQTLRTLIDADLDRVVGGTKVQFATAACTAGCGTIMVQSVFTC